MSDRLPGQRLRRALLLLLPLAVLGIAVLGSVALRSMRKPPSRHRAQDTTPRVRAVRLVPRSVRLDASGFGAARSASQVQVVPQVGGRVVHMSAHLKVGGYVSKDEVLIEIDPADYRIALDHAEAELKRSEANRDGLRQQATNATRQIGVAAANLAIVEREAARLGKLYATRVASESQFNAAQQQALSARAELVRYENTLALLPAQEAQAEAQIQSAKAQRDRARLDLARVRIPSPFDARVLQTSVDLGQVVQVGRSVALLADAALMEVPVLLEPALLRNLRLPGAGGGVAGRGSGAVVKAVGGAVGATWPGELVRVEPVDPKTRQAPAVVMVRSPTNGSGVDAYRLSEGVFCHVTLAGTEKADAMVIPSVALREDDVVYIGRPEAPDAATGVAPGQGSADSRGGSTRPRRVSCRLVTVPVQVRHRLGDEVVIEGGVSPGDRVITSLLLNPVEGMRLQVEEETP